jgi:hypothetical protein
MQAIHFCWGAHGGYKLFDFQWDIINHLSYVLISVSEGREGRDADSHRMNLTTQSPRKFLGSARMTVNSIAPHDGGVTFGLTIEYSPVIVWTDIIVFGKELVTSENDVESVL